MIFIRLCAAKLGASLIAQLVKNLPAMQEILVWSLGWENPLDKGMATHFSILAGEFPQTEELVRLKSSTVQLLSCVQHFAALWTATGQSSQCITKSWNLLNSCPSSRWCHPTILSSVILFSSCPQGLFQWVSSSHHVAKVLEFQLQHQSFQWTPRTDLP